MRTLGNILWLVLAGFWLAIGYVLAGIVMCLLIITIPLGLQAFKLANFALWPFGRTVVEQPDANLALGCLGNVVWLVLVGWELAIAPRGGGRRPVPHDRGHPAGHRLLQDGPARAAAVRQGDRVDRRLPPGAPMSYAPPPTLGDPRPM